MRGARGRRLMLGGLLALLAVVVLSIGLGPVRVAPVQVLRILLSRLPGATLQVNWPDTYEAIVWNIRLPRVLLSVLVGMALAAAGTAYQALFRNPLADPYVLGVSSGAALGAALAFLFLEALRLPLLGPVPVAAFLGGLTAVGLVYRLSVVGGRVPVVALLLAGVAVGTCCSSLLSLILFLTSPRVREAIIFWTMGGLGGANWSQVAWLLPYVGVGLGLLAYRGREINALLLGDDAARHLGVDVDQLKRLVLAAGALLTASAVAFCGGIGFIGLIVPHLSRFLVGPDHRYLLPTAVLFGGVMLAAADTVARSISGATEIPVGLVMAALGGPFFLWLLRRRLVPRDVR